MKIGVSFTEPESPSVKRHFSILSPNRLNNNVRKASISLYQPFTVLSSTEKEEVKMLDKWVNDFQYHSSIFVRKTQSKN